MFDLTKCIGICLARAEGCNPVDRYYVRAARMLGYTVREITVEELMRNE
jgi:hypothetical protein